MRVLLLAAFVAACGGRSDATVDGGGEGGSADAAVELECVEKEDCAGIEICVANECIPATCDDSQLTGNESDVDCGGDCAPCTEGQLCIGANDCMTLFCDGAAGDAVCRDCQINDDCAGAPGTYCESGLCTPTRALGETCDSGDECTSGNCADGVCCDTPCDGSCETCGTGSCTAVPAGDDPDGDCPDDGACGRDGTCDGAGGCRLYANGTSCPLNSCAGGQSGTGTCNGAGACLSAGESCDPYTCNGSTCRSSCSNDSHCISGYYCSGSSCVLKLANGQPCSGNNDSQCQSNSCTDGYCCNSDCTGTCRSCNGALTASNNGVCANVLASAGAQSDCSAAPNCPNGSCCGNTGTCNGGGACTKRASGTTCVAQSCSNSVQSAARTCNGSGTCTSGSTTSCAPYTCGGNSCRTSCSSPSHCQSGYTCQNNACVLLAADGAACGMDSQCLNGVCGPNSAALGPPSVCCARIDFGQGNGPEPCPVANNTPPDFGWYCLPNTGACTLHVDIGGPF